MILCKKCGTSWSLRGFADHERECTGQVEGFHPIKVKNRIFMQCQTCGGCIRKQYASSHKAYCSKANIKKDHSNIDDECKDATITKLSIEQKQNCVEENISLPNNISLNEQKNKQEEQQQENQQVFFFQKEQHQQGSGNISLINKNGKTISFDPDEIQADEQQSHPHFSTLQDLNLEAIRAHTANLCQTDIIFKIPRLQGFRKNRLQNPPGMPLTIEMLTLSCLLRIIGQYTRENRWTQNKYLVKKQDFWKFLRQAQGWIANNHSFTCMAQQKMAIYNYDADYFYVANFDQLYLRLKDLLEHYTISPEKITKIFTRPVYHRNKRHSRVKRRHPETAKTRAKIARYFSRIKRKRQRHIVKRFNGPRPLTKLHYQALQYQVKDTDANYEMLQVFSKIPSKTHQRQVFKKRQKMMENFIMGVIADDITASVILGSFKTWTVSMENINPELRYLYTDKIPNIPHFAIWYPIPLSILQERKWLFPTIYYQCQGFFEQKIPEETEESIFKKLLCWYARKKLLITNSTWEVQKYDEIRGELDAKYRIQQEQKRISYKAGKYQIRPIINYFEKSAQQMKDENQNEDDGLQQINFAPEIPRKGDKYKWSMIHENQNKTIFSICSYCSQKIQFPTHCCIDCFALYHNQCKKQLMNDECLCLEDPSLQKKKKFMQRAINKAKKHLKEDKIIIQKPYQANQMEIQFQEKNLGLNLPQITKSSLWCQPATIKFYQDERIKFMDQNLMQILIKFEERIFVFPVIIKEIQKKGRGLVASREILENEIVANMSGALISQAITNSMYRLSSYVFIFQRGDNLFNTWNIVPDAVAGIGMFINHSDNPNVEPHRFWSTKGPVVLFIARRKIKRNEEIELSYKENFYRRRNQPDFY